MRYSLRAGGLAVVVALAATLVLFRPDTPQAVAAQPAELPADLALVPADAAGFAHVRLADVWKSDLMAGFRQTFEKAGPKAAAALDAQFVPPPSTLSRGTVFFVLDDGKRPVPVGVLTFSAAFDPDAVVKSYLPNAAAEKVGGKTVYRSPESELELYFPDNKHIVVGGGGSLNAYLSKPVAKDGPLAAALKQAAGGKAAVACISVAALPIPKDAMEGAPAELKPLLKAERLTVSVELGAGMKIDVAAGYADATAAQDAEKAVKALAELGRKELAKIKKDYEGRLFNPKAKGPRPVGDLPEGVATVFALGAITQADELLANPGALVKRNGAELTASFSVSKELVTALGGSAGAMIGLLLPAVQKVRESAARMQSQNNLKQIGIAVHAYHDANGHLPQDIVDKNGKPILSWRVLILPYIEQDNLYKLFKLDEPWDSDNNKAASQAWIKVFMSPSGTLPERPEFGLTSYRGIAGPDAIFEPGKKVRFADVTDGLSNTIMVIETDEMVPWAKPGDFPFDPKKALPKIVPPGKKPVFNVLMGDGSVRAIVPTIEEKTLKALFTRNGGEVIDD
jgi:hypothetical protein